MTLTLKLGCDLHIFEDCDCDLISRSTLKLGCDIDSLGLTLTLKLGHDLDLEIRL